MASTTYPFIATRSSRARMAPKADFQAVDRSNIKCASATKLRTYTNNCGRMPLSTKLCTEVSPRMPDLVRKVLYKTSKNEISRK